MSHVRDESAEAASAAVAAGSSAGVSNRCAPAETGSAGHAAADVQEAENGAANPAAVALLPADLLQPGELILLVLKPSPLFIFLEPLTTLLALGLVTAGAVGLNELISTGVGNTNIAVAGAAIISVRLFWQFLDWLSRLYVLTDRRVVRVRGVLRVHIFETPLRNVQHIDVSLSVRERLFGLGTLGFATSGTGGIEAVWRMIARPVKVHQQVAEAIRRYGR